MIKNGSNSLAIECFKDHPGQPLEAPKDQDRKKGKGGKTVSSYFKGQLDDLMTTLYKTEPHFIRCVVPNTHKEPGGVESGLVMHQYQCNGVLAGIAICRKGFPNKVLSMIYFLSFYDVYDVHIITFCFRCCIPSSRRGTTSSLPRLLPRPRTTRQPLDVSWMW